jgi:hypothetical protein
MVGHNQVKESQIVARIIAICHNSNELITGPTTLIFQVVDSPGLVPVQAPSIYSVRSGTPIPYFELVGISAPP